MPSVWCLIRAEDDAVLSDKSSLWDLVNFVRVTGEPDNLSAAVVSMLVVWARSLRFVELA